MKAAKKKSKYRKNANGFGSIRKMPGSRRRPYQVLVTMGWEEVNGKKKQIQKPIGYTETHEEALALLVDYHRSPFEAPSNMTFKDVYNSIDTSRMSSSKLSAMKTAYRRSEPLHKLRITEIKKPQLQKIADSMTDFSKPSQAEVRILWNAVFKYGLEHDIIQKDYSKFVDWVSDYVPSKKMPFTVDEVKQFSDDLLILCFTGMRISEYLAVRTEDVYDGIIHGVGTKTEASLRNIPIHSKIAEIVNQRLSGVYLCEGQDGQMTYSYFLVQKFYPEMQQLRIKGHTIHDTRRTFATFASASGMDDKIRKRLLGHKLNDLTEDVYTVPDIERLKTEMNKLVIF